VREQELRRAVVVDLDAERRQEVARLVEDAGDEGVFEESEGGFHRLAREAPADAPARKE
jgi:hypothetical protein